MSKKFDNNEKPKVYQTILVLSLALLLAFWYFELKYFLYGAILLITFSLLTFRVAYYIHIGWMKLAEGLAWINTRLLLGIVFYIMLLPISLLRRLFQSNSMTQGIQKDQETYYVDTTDKKVNFEQPW